MKFKITYIIALFYVISCTKKDFKFPIYKKEIHYLNKDNIEIIEFENNKIFRYILRDSIKKELNKKDVIFYENTFDSLRLSNNDTLVYKKVTLNTKESIDFSLSKFWTAKHKGKGQEWYSFSETKNPNSLFKNYTYYISKLNVDTLKQGYYDTGGFKKFDKFNFMFLGTFNTTGCLISKVNQDSLNVIPINHFSKPTNKAPFYLIPYNSIQTKLHIGKWKLETTKLCEFNDITLNELIIKSDSLYFTNNNKEVLKIKYQLGLDSKYLELFPSERTWENSLIRITEIKVLQIKNNTLKIELSYSGGICHTNDTLIFKKINHQK